jgi:NitT/TauT family transport system ATP-binding protein
VALVESRFRGNNKDMPLSITTTILQVKEVSKTFAGNTASSPSQSHVVLNKISLNVMAGEFVTIVGASGCGKSTLLNIMSGLDRPDSGSVIPRNGSSSSRIVVFQEGALFPWLTVFENVEFGLRIAKVPKDRRKQVASHFIDMVQLSRFADSYVYQLSGGMKQRVAIARALALDPDVLLMDEPFAALDVQTRDMLHKQLLQIHEATKKTILFVTHNINEAITLGDRVVILSSRLGNIKREFAISLPRPRNPDSPEFGTIIQQILKELEDDFQHARRTTTTSSKETAQ